MTSPSRRHLMWAIPLAAALAIGFSLFGLIAWCGDDVPDPCHGVYWDWVLDGARLALSMILVGAIGAWMVLFFAPWDPSRYRRAVVAGLTAIAIVAIGVAYLLSGLTQVERIPTPW